VLKVPLRAAPELEQMARSHGLEPQLDCMDLLRCAERRHSALGPVAVMCSPHPGVHPAGFVLGVPAFGRCHNRLVRCTCFFERFEE
jgi:hypothetical protein